MVVHNSHHQQKFNCCCAVLGSQHFLYIFNDCSREQQPAQAVLRAQFCQPGHQEQMKVKALPHLGCLKMLMATGALHRSYSLCTLKVQINIRVPSKMSSNLAEICCSLRVLSEGFLCGRHPAPKDSTKT